MAEFKYYTRGGSSPQGKARVYYTAHPSDHDRCMKDIREDVFKRQNCAVFCVDPELRTDEIEDYELRLSQMQLLIVPVTAKLLTTSNRAIDTGRFDKRGDTAAKGSPQTEYPGDYPHPRMGRPC